MDPLCTAFDTAINDKTMHGKGFLSPFYSASSLRFILKSSERNTNPTGITFPGPFVLFFPLSKTEAGRDGPSYGVYGVRAGCWEGTCFFLLLVAITVLIHDMNPPPRNHVYIDSSPAPWFFSSLYLCISSTILIIINLDLFLLISLQTSPDHQPRT